VQDAINEFWNNITNQKEIFSYESQIEKCAELAIKGELFFVLFKDIKTGLTEVASLNQDEIIDVITDKDNRNKVLCYKRMYSAREYNYSSGTYGLSTVKTSYYLDYNLKDSDIPKDIPKDQLAEGRVYHVKINSISSKRGISELFVILGWGKLYKQMNEDLAAWVKALSRFAWTKKVKKGGKSVIDQLRLKYQAKFNQSNPAPAAASTSIETESVENKPMQFASGAADWATDIRQMRLGIAAGSGFGEQYFGDPSTANLAIGEKMELPLLKNIETWQKLWEDIFYNLINYGVKDVVSTEDDEGNIVPLEIDIDFPPIVIQDIQKLTTSLQIAVQTKIIDLQEARLLALTGLGVNNAAEVIERMEEEDEEEQKNAPAAPTNQTPEEKAAAEQKAKEKLAQMDAQARESFERGVKMALSEIKESLEDKK